MSRTARIPVVALLAAIVLAACSSDDGSIESVIDADVAGTAAVSETTETTEPTAAADGASTTEADEPTATAASPTTEAEAPATTSAAPTGDDICVPLKELSDYDVASSALVNSAEWPEIQTFFVDSTPPVLDVYDQAIALDTDLADELETLRAITSETATLAADAGDLEELGNGLLEMPGIMEAGEAALTLNEFAQDNCGFSTGGN